MEIFRRPRFNAEALVEGSHKLVQMLVGLLNGADGVKLEFQRPSLLEGFEQPLYAPFRLRTASQNDLYAEGIANALVLGVVARFEMCVPLTGWKIPCRSLYRDIGMPWARMCLSRTSR